jgi:polyferredoxin
MRSHMAGTVIERAPDIQIHVHSLMHEADFGCMRCSALLDVPRGDQFAMILLRSRISSLTSATLLSMLEATLCCGLDVRCTEMVSSLIVPFLLNQVPAKVRHCCDRVRWDTCATVCGRTEVGDAVMSVHVMQIHHVV